jgi:Protein of unknown function (DUF1552)
MNLSARRPITPITRRDLLRSIGGAALALPMLELFPRRASAQAAAKKSKFVVFCYTPDGVNQKTFWPTGTTTNFQLSPILAPFEPYKTKMLVLGPQMDGTTPKNGTGLAYAAQTPQHQAPVTLSARIGSGCEVAGAQNCLVGNYGLRYLDQNTAVNRIDGPSIDQVIAKAVQGDSLFSSLNFGLHPIGGDTPSDIHFAQDGTSLRRMATADEAWNRIFGGVMPAGAPALASSLRKHNAVTEFLNARFAILRPALGAHDRQTIDGHLAALRSYEARKATQLVATATQDAQCTNPTRRPVTTDATAVRTGADTETLCPFFMDLIATSFQCNFTKVASLTFGYPGGGDAGGLRMPWLGFSEPLHGISHHGNNPVNLDKYTKMQTWIAGQIAQLMQRLAAIPAPGGGTLLNQTTIYWFNRHGDGDSHSNWALPNVLLGGTGGYFQMGRVLQLPATSPTKVLISIANAMGIDVPSFGKDGLAATVPLAGLAA